MRYLGYTLLVLVSVLTLSIVNGCATRTKSTSTSPEFCPTYVVVHNRCTTLGGCDLDSVKELEEKNIERWSPHPDTIAEIEANQVAHFELCPR